MAVYGDRHLGLLATRKNTMLRLVGQRVESRVPGCAALEIKSTHNRRK